MSMPMNPTVVLYTLTYQITGQVSSAGRRLSDYLNDPRTDCMTVERSAGRSLLAGSSPSSMGSLAIKKESLQFVAAVVDALDPLRPRVPTEPVRMAIGLDFFTLHGTLNRRSGDASDPGVFLTRPNRSFVPLTDVGYSYLPNNDFDGRAPVLFVNASQIRFCTTHWCAVKTEDPRLLVPA
jgi:hypothetical protein